MEPGPGLVWQCRMGILTDPNSASRSKLANLVSTAHRDACTMQSHYQYAHTYIELCR